MTRHPHWFVRVTLVRQGKPIKTISVVVVKAPDCSIPRQSACVFGIFMSPPYKTCLRPSFFFYTLYENKTNLLITDYFSKKIRA